MFRIAEGRLISEPTPFSFPFLQECEMNGRGRLQGADPALFVVSGDASRLGTRN